MEFLDYNRSFCLATGDGNQPRFAIESRTRIINANGEIEDFFQTAACRGERTFGSSVVSLFTDDAQHGSRMFGPNGTVWYRMAVAARPNLKRDGRTIVGSEPWGGPVRNKLVDVQTRELTTHDEIVQATHDMAPLLARTEISNRETELTAIIEYPIKTMNTVVPHDMPSFRSDFRNAASYEVLDGDELACVYQVDTGPVAFPDLALATDSNSERIHLAFIAFNRPDIANFVIIQPTPIEADGKQVASAHYYSRFEQYEAINRVYAVE